jgi:hypothetical protein
VFGASGALNDPFNGSNTAFLQFFIQPIKLGLITFVGAVLPETAIETSGSANDFSAYHGANRRRKSSATSSIADCRLINRRFQRKGIDYTRFTPIDRL